MSYLKKADRSIAGSGKTTTKNPEDDDILDQDFESFLNNKEESFGEDDSNSATDTTSSSTMPVFKRGSTSSVTSGSAGANKEWLKSKLKDKIMNTSMSESKLKQSVAANEVHQVGEVETDVDEFEDQEAEEKRKFFDILEAENPNVDYGKLNEDLAEDSVDLMYTDDFEPATAASDPDPASEVGNKRSLKNLKSGDGDDDDLESIRSSLQDIESSLDMSDAELPNVALKQPIVRQPLPSSSSSTPVVQSAAPVSTIIPTRTVPTPDTKQMAKELEFMQNILDKERESARKFKADFESQQSELEKLRREFKIYEVENRDLKVQLEKVNIKLEAASVSADEISQQHSLAIDEQGLREQETLLKAYELENERMTRHIKELEHKLKNGSVEFDEERQRLHNEISLLNTRLSEKEGSDPRERRREEDKQKQVEAIRVQFQSVEADLRAQIDQLQVNMGQKANEEKVKLEKEYQLKLLNAQQKEKQLSKELKEKDGEIRELKSQILKKNAAATAKESKLKQPATSSMKSLSNLSDLKRVRQLEADLFDMQAKCREFEAQLAGQNKAFSEQLAVVEKEKVWLQDEAAARLSELRDEHLRVLQTLKEKNRAVEGAQSEIVKLKQSIADDPSGSGHLVHLESKLSQTEQDLKSAKQRLEKLENVESAMETVKGVAETLRGELNVRQREVEKMKGELFGTQQELAVAQKELAKKHAIIEHNLQQMSDLSSKTHASILHKSDTETSLKAELEVIQKKLMSLEVENATLKQKLEMSEMLRQSLTVEYKKAFEEVRRDSALYSAKTDGHNESLAGKEREIVRLQNSNSQAETQISQLNSKIASLSNELEQLRGKLAEENKKQQPENPKYRDLYEQTVEENVRLKHQVGLVKRNGGNMGADLWQTIVDQLSNVELRLKQSEKKWKEIVSDQPSAASVEQLQMVRDRYDQMLRHRDDQLERLRAQLETRIS